MTIGIVVFSQALADLLVAAIAAEGHAHGLFESVGAALDASAGLVFAEWPLDRSVSDLLDGLARATLAQAPTPVAVFVPGERLT